MSRLPIRLRITLAFAAAMALVLFAVGLFLYLRLGDQLTESLDNGLRTRAGEVSALVLASGSVLGGSGDDALIESEEAFAQLLSIDGQVLDSTTQLGGKPVLTAAEASQAAAEATFFERQALTGVEGEARLLATPIENASGESTIVVVGASLDDRNEAQSNLATLLGIGGPIALLLASLAGYTALNRTLTRLELALDSERRFVDDASHELRTPLALQKTELELAMRYDATEEELRAAISSAAEEVDRLIALAEGLLVVARSGEGELATSIENVAVADLFETIEARFRGRAERSGRGLTLSDPGELAVRGDRLRLEQALTGLVDNAFVHAAGEVVVEARAADRWVELHIRDHGEGFPPAFIDRAFERFSRADESRARGGTGLGLAIVAAIAKAHDGKAGVRNNPEGGADVWISLPRAD